MKKGLNMPIENVKDFVCRLDVQKDFHFSGDQIFVMCFGHQMVTF